MTKRARYFLIFLCIAAFLVLAPFVVFYVKGVTYDTGDNKYLSTGILSIQTDPKNVQIFLNEELADTTPADIRFLKPGGYNIKLLKKGYRPWTKRIEILGNKVSWASPSIEKIVLFFETPKRENIAEGILDFEKLPSGWLYLTSKNLILSNNENASDAKSFSLPKPVTKITGSSNNQFFLLSSGKTTLLFNLNTKSFKDVSSILKDSVSYDFDLENNLWVLKSNQLIKVDINSVTQTVVAKSVSAFYLQDNTPYYVQKNSAGEAEIFLLALTNGKLESQKVVGPVPFGEKTELVVTNQKEIFILAGTDLYRINELNQKLQSGVIWWQYNSGSESLVFATGSELGFYNFFKNDIQLISRSGNGFSNPQLYFSLGFVFYAQNNQLIAAELDTSDHQNTYILAELNEDAKFSIDNEAKQIYVQNNGKLERLQIR